MAIKLVNEQRGSQDDLDNHDAKAQAEHEAPRSSMSAHTPGPWTACAYSGVVGIPVIAQPDPKENSVVICGVRGDKGTAEANARLIATAPAMLGLLDRAEWLLRELPGLSNEQAELLDDICTTLAEAKGSQQ